MGKSSKKKKRARRGVKKTRKSKRSSPGRSPAGSPHDRDELILPKPRKGKKPSMSASASGSGSGKKKSKEKPEKKSLWQRLYADEAAGLFRVVRVSPLFFGSWAASGIVLDQLIPLILLTTAITFSFASSAVSEREDILFKREFVLLYYLLQLGFVFAYFSLVNSPQATVLLALVMVLISFSELLAVSLPRHVILRVLSLIVEMGVLATLGVFTQVFALQTKISLQWSILGLIPGTVLAAAFVASNVAVLKKAGWDYSAKRMTRKGVERVVPRGISQLYSAVLIIGPACAVSLSPIGYLPLGFFAVAPSFYFIPKLAEAFLNQEVDSELMVVRTCNVAALVSFLTFIGAFVSVQGWV